VIHAGVSELRQAFAAHCAAARNGNGRSYNLLLFYAAECGLKKAWLEQSKLKRTSDLSAECLQSIGHDLLLLTKELHLSAQLVKSIPSCVRARRRAEIQPGLCRMMDIPISRVHEAWRYGVTLE
jgi:hypothetical protein